MSCLLPNNPYPNPNHCCNPLTMKPTHKKRHINAERTVHCPIEGCDETPLARGVHLHVRQSSADGHGSRGEVPSGITFDDLETAGQRNVSLDYPEHRQTEDTARLCPYCKQAFRGKQGVMIHLGQVTGRNGHPDDAQDTDASELPIAHVDEHNNVLDVVEGEEHLPATEERLAEEETEAVLTRLREAGILDDEEEREARKLVA